MILISMNWAARIVTGSRSDPEPILKCFGCFFTVKFDFFFLKCERIISVFMNITQNV